MRYMEMRLTTIVAAVAITLFVAAPAGATNRGNTYNYDYDLNSNSNSARADVDASANASGVGIGIAKGGDANVNSSNRNTNRLSQSQGQSQSSVQGMVGINGQSLKGVGSGNTTAVTVHGDTVEAPKKADVPAIAPNVAPGDPTATCIATWAGSGAYGGFISLGGSGYVYSKPCLWGEVARAASQLGQSDLARAALVNMFEQTLAITGKVTEEDVKTATAKTNDDGFNGLDSLYE